MPSDSRIHEYARYSGIAVEISATMALPVAAGYYADSYLETHPWLLLLGIVLGLAGIIIYLYKLGIQSQQKPQPHNKNKQE
jgi:F0F1-type ATP synthase assembly protein I